MTTESETPDIEIMNLDDLDKKLEKQANDDANQKNALLAEISSQIQMENELNNDNISSESDSVEFGMIKVDENENIKQSSIETYYSSKDSNNNNNNDSNTDSDSNIESKKRQKRKRKRKGNNNKHNDGGLENLPYLNTPPQSKSKSISSNLSNNNDNKNRKRKRNELSDDDLEGINKNKKQKINGSGNGILDLISDSESDGDGQVSVPQLLNSNTYAKIAQQVNERIVISDDEDDLDILNKNDINNNNNNINDGNNGSNIENKNNINDDDNKNDGNNDDKITLKIEKPNGKGKLPVKMLLTQTFELLYHNLTKKYKLIPKLSFDGMIIKKTDTPKNLDLEDQDMLDVIWE